MHKLMIAVVSLATALTSLPAMAAPAFVARPMGQVTTSAPDAIVQTVGCNNMTNCPELNPRWGHGSGRYDRDRDRRDYRSDRRDYSDRDRRHHSNAGAIIGGLAAGAVIGGIIASQGNRSAGTSHQQYCASKYRSYRASDNSYQPLSGPRQPCR